MEALAAGYVVPEWDHAIEEVTLAARCSATTVLITADCVAAVERLARRIHAASARAASPFVLVAAASLPGDAALLTETCADLLDTASGGSLLLTDVEDIPSTVQSRLIETFACLQAALKPKSRVRLMAGTTTILHERISDGTFSEQLFYRLNGIHVVVKNDWASASAAGVA
jgi:DNA-binding NtrC family response regulator